MFVGPGEPSSFKRYLNQTQKKLIASLNKYISTHDPLRQISIIRGSTKIKIIYYQPIHSVRHVNAFKPMKKISFIRMGTGGIDVS